MSGAGKIWMPLYIKDYIEATQELSLEQSGAYLHLLMRSWGRGPLPSEDRQLALICKVSEKKFIRDIKPTVMGMFLLTEAGYVQKRLEIERQKTQSNIDQKSEAGKASARARNYKKQQVILTDVVTGVATEDTTEIELKGNSSPSPSPTPSSVKSKKDTLPSEAIARRVPSQDLFAAGVVTPTPSKVHRVKPEVPSEAEIEEGFAEFWKLYPVKEARAPAWKNFRLAALGKLPEKDSRKSGDHPPVSMASMIAGAQRYREKVQNYPKDRTPKYAQGWLTERRWQDGAEGEEDTRQMGPHKDTWADWGLHRLGMTQDQGLMIGSVGND